jgi:hypothetical protein
MFHGKSTKLTCRVGERQRVAVPLHTISETDGMCSKTQEVTA